LPPKFATYITFSELNNGVAVTLDQFRAELSRFNGIQVFYVCAVMNSMIMDWQGNARLDAVEHFVKNSFIPQVAQKIVAALNDPLEPRGIYHRQQLLFVAKEGLSVCGKVGGDDPLLPAHSGRMARVLLMANDLLPKRVTTPAPTADQMVNVMSEFIPIGEASGFQNPIYKILRTRLMFDRFLPRQDEYRSVFATATGVPLEDYFALCFASLCKYVDFGYAKYQSDPGSFILAASWYGTTPIEASVLDRFLIQISASFDEFEDFLGRRVYAANDFTCFRGKPYLRDEANHLLVDPMFLAEKGDSGVFWAINHALDRRQRLQFHGDWGAAFEGYVNWLMDASIDGCTNRLYKNPRFSDNGEEVCDSILQCDDSMVFVESKGATFTAEAKYGLDPEKLRSEIEAKFITTEEQRKGIGQLAARIEQVFNRNNPRLIEGVDTSRIVKVYPLLITRDDIGAALVMNAYLAYKFRDLFHRKAVSVTVTPPFSLSAQDIEMLCGYLRDASVAELLEARYRADPNLLSSFWLVDNALLDRLGQRKCRILNESLHEYFTMIKERLFPGLSFDAASEPGT
jgi:hypothetical protein